MITRVISLRPRSRFRAGQKPQRLAFGRFHFKFPNFALGAPRFRLPVGKGKRAGGTKAVLDAPAGATGLFRGTAPSVPPHFVAEATLGPIVPADVLPPSRPEEASRAADPALWERSVAASLGRYSIRLATCAEDRIAACRLRFEVFNLELGEGLSASYYTGIDEDEFDSICDHLIVEDQTEGRIVGTYRMQSGLTAATNLGYYSEQEFDFAPYESIRYQVLELGRASIDRQHRSSEVLTLLWRGIAQYAKLFGLRYLIGCSSLTSKDPREGRRLYRQLSSSFLAPCAYLTVPTARFSLMIDADCDEGADASGPVHCPKLLKTYLAIGARICGPPAWDREFGTIDFLPCSTSINSRLRRATGSCAKAILNRASPNPVSWRHLAW
jgi:putative hemolysin